MRWPRITRTGSTGWSSGRPSSRACSLTAPVRPRAGQRAAVASRLQPARQVNEELVRGREDIFFGAEYAAWAGTPLPDEVVKYYIDRLASDPKPCAAASSRTGRSTSTSRRARSARFGG